jgi:hypothetical protein
VSREWEGAVDDMQVKCQIFRSSLKPWDSLCEEAATFATGVGREHLINISVSEDHDDGVIVVWYWE